MSQPSSESQLYSHAHRLLKTHDTLVRDEVRNRAFYAALERSVTRDSCVLDIGAGVGIWAVAAAKLGAKRVVAIEMDELLVGMTRKLAAEHGVADRVEVIWGNSFGIGLAGLSNYVQGQNGGTETVTLTANQIGDHAHTLGASSANATTNSPANAVASMNKTFLLR